MSRIEKLSLPVTKFPTVSLNLSHILSWLYPLWHCRRTVYDTSRYYILFSLFKKSVLVFWPHSDLGHPLGSAIHFAYIDLKRSRKSEIPSDILHLAKQFPFLYTLVNKRGPNSPVHFTLTLVSITDSHSQNHNYNQSPWSDSSAFCWETGQLHSQF